VAFCRSRISGGTDVRMTGWRLAPYYMGTKLRGAAGGRELREMDDQAEIRRRLEELRIEHRDLDAVIARVAETAPFDQIQLQRLKKRKLILRDRIALLESKQLPDIIA
jgi:hypothetical protein